MRISTLRRGFVALALAVCVPSAAAAAAITVKGKLSGIQSLLNPVWNEAKDPKNHRFTFREPSATVSKDVRILMGHLPKELCIAVLGPEKAQAEKVPLRMVIAGGRTTPVTLVVAEGQQIQLENHDPFKHKLYTTDPKGGFPDAELLETKSITWTPPGPGKYEIRDKLVPSLRTWIVVEPNTVTVGYPNRKGEFALALEPGTYTLQGYFNGEAVGEAMPLELKPAPTTLQLQKPLKVGEAKPKKKKGDDKGEEKQEK